MEILPFEKSNYDLSCLLSSKRLWMNKQKIFVHYSRGNPQGAVFSAHSPGCLSPRTTKHGKRKHFLNKRSHLYWFLSTPYISSWVFFLRSWLVHIPDHLNCSYICLTAHLQVNQIHNSVPENAVWLQNSPLWHGKHCVKSYWTI